ncbi:MAG: amidohydrolase family protein [Synergistaceae bacterium]|jgi:predicted TIM-barrel fold metal-dependent hydrolase|nr:amidohydrolase family protein [Synergistaceae bacterium]
MIIDAHVHVYPPEIISGAEGIAQRESYFSSLVSAKAHRWAGAEDVLSAMDSDGVDESWIFGFGFKDLGLCRVCNDYALDAAARSGGRLKPLAVVPPLARGAAAEIARCAHRGAIGVGEIFPDGQDFDITDTDETWRFAAACHENGMFVLLHTAEPVGREYPGKGRAGPREAYAFARNHPELRIVMAHWGGGLFMYESLPDARLALRNVRYDTAAAPFVYDSKIFSLCGAPWVRDKILYGSDFPLLRYPRYKEMMDASGLAPEAADRIGSANALRFLDGRE